MITVEGVSYIGSTVVSKTIRLGSIPSTPAKEASKNFLLAFFVFRKPRVRRGVPKCL